MILDTYQYILPSELIGYMCLTGSIIHELQFFIYLSVHKAVGRVISLCYSVIFCWPYFVTQYYSSKTFINGAYGQGKNISPGT